jgi:hypothetical protein
MKKRFSLLTGLTVAGRVTTRRIVFDLFPVMGHRVRFHPCSPVSFPADMQTG